MRHLMHTPPTLLLDEHSARVGMAYSLREGTRHVSKLVATFKALPWWKRAFKFREYERMLGMVEVLQVMTTWSLDAEIRRLPDDDGEG